MAFFYLAMLPLAAAIVARETAFISPAGEVEPSRFLQGRKLNQHSKEKSMNNILGRSWLKQKSKRRKQHQKDRMVTTNPDPHNMEETTNPDPHNMEETTNPDPHNMEETTNPDPHNMEETTNPDPHNMVTDIIAEMLHHDHDPSGIIPESPQQNQDSEAAMQEVENEEALMRTENIKVKSALDMGDKLSAAAAKLRTAAHGKMLMDAVSGSHSGLLLETHSRYAASALDLYDEADKLDAQAQEKYLEASGTYVLANNAADYNDWIKARAHWDYDFHTS